MWRFSFRRVATLSTRIRYAAFIVHFLGIWRNFIHLNKNMDIKTALLTRESYQDALISTHFAVILICYMRDNFPNTPCRLDLTGSDPCECLFSLTGQWVGNRHNYSFGEMLDNINNMMRLQIMHHGGFGRFGKFVH